MNIFLNFLILLSSLIISISAVLPNVNEIELLSNVLEKRNQCSCSVFFATSAYIAHMGLLTSSQDEHSQNYNFGYFQRKFPKCHSFS